MSKQPVAHMNLCAFLYADANYSRTGWRHPDAFSDAGGLRFDRWVQMAQLLEAAKFDMLFVADQISAPGVDQRETFCRTASIAGFEPLTLLAALAQATTRLGLAATVNTTWSEPYNTARMLASLDRISNGRAAWNVVTGRNPEDALNFSKSKHVEHADRYEIAEEFVDICRGLWDSFDDDAFLRDKASGQFVDPEKLHLLEHKGEHFAVRGPLNVPRPVQGYPLIIQAGASEAAREMAARGADCLFTAQSRLADAQVFYADIKGRLAKYGRTPGSLRILPGVSVYAGRTRGEANEKFEFMQSTTPVEFAVKQLGTLMGGMDFSGLPVDGPIPPLEPNLAFINPEEVAKSARAQNLTLGQWALRVAASKSHLTLVGSPTDIADELEAWFRGGAADGFNLLPPHVPGSLQDFVDLVLPELRRRDLFRSEYEGATLREHMHVERPVDRSRRPPRPADVVPAEMAGAPRA
jgi:FMN-dependent oxidoreductase (nitrilotriacetate monooxygenase family)